MNRLAILKLSVLIAGLLSIQSFSSCEAVDDLAETIDEVDSLSTATLNPQVESDSIDVNNDGILDFQFLMQAIQTTDVSSSGGSLLLQLHPLDENAIGCLEPDCNANEVAEGTLISDETFSWNEHARTITYINRSGSRWDFSWSSDCCEGGTGYIAIRLEKSAQYFYGWIQFGVDVSSGDVSILAFNVNDYAGNSILAGEMDE